MATGQFSLLFVCFALIGGNENDETRLLTKLFSNYNNAARPVKFANESVHVRTHFNLRNIVELDLKNEILSVTMWAFYTWRDQSLLWNTTDYNGLEALHIPSSKIWLPEIVLTNGIRDKRTDTVDSSTVVLQYDGRVLWMPPLYLRALCAVDVRYYPFDEQECNLTFVPWSHTAKTVHLSLHQPRIDTEKYSPTSFDLIHADQNEQTDFLDGKPTITKIIVYVKFRRKILYHTYTIIFPFVMISILNLLIFRITPESGEKISLGITVLLAFLVLLSIISEKMPESSKSIPLIALYMCFVMAVTNLSIALSVMVISLHSRGSSTHVPRWMQWLLLRKLGFLVGLKKHQLSSPGSVRRRAHLKNSIIQLVSNITQIPMVEARTIINRQEYKRSSTLPERMNDGFQLKSDEFCVDRALLKEILDAVKAILYKQELGDEHSDVRQEWRAVAMVLDRLFFWLFACLTALVSIYLLFLLPNTSTN